MLYLFIVPIWPKDIRTNVKHIARQTIIGTIRPLTQHSSRGVGQGGE